MRFVWLALAGVVGCGGDPFTTGGVGTGEATFDGSAGVATVDGSAEPPCPLCGASARAKMSAPPDTVTDASVTPEGHETVPEAAAEAKAEASSGVDASSAPETSSPTPEAAPPVEACATLTQAAACAGVKCGYASIGCGAYTKCPDTTGANGGACGPIQQAGYCMPGLVVMSCFYTCSMPPGVCPDSHSSTSTTAIWCCQF